LTEATLSILEDVTAAKNLVTAGRRRLEQIASPAGYADKVCSILADCSTQLGRRRAA
jgi:hypothetical protein